ncbi:MAG TPA: hypothetical protein VIV63_15900, partial [Steroidobacteraceae bacterium]
GATRYELWRRASESGTWLKVQDRPAAATYTIIAVSAHLLDWRGARWRVDACDASGCTPSAEVSATSLMRDSVGFIKPVPELPPRRFGMAMALSADGRTLAVLGAEFWTNISLLPYVYVYRRVGSNWVFDARLASDNARENDNVGTSVALNSDGSVLVWGTQFTPYPNDTGGTVFRGAVYVFRRVAGAWQRDHKVTAPNEQTMYLGRDVDVSDDGERFVASYQSLPYRMGHTQIYHRVSGAWQLEKTLTMRTSGSHWAECIGLALSGNGQRVARYCTRSPHSPALAGKFVETYSAPRWTLEAEIQLGSHIHYPDFLRVIGAIDISGDGTRLVSMHSHESTLSVWRWNGSAWEADSPAGALAELTTPGLSVAMSRNGNLIVQGDEHDVTVGVGAIYPPYQVGVASTGIARVYERRGGTWTLRQMIKGNSPASAAYYRQGFGSTVALGDNGSVLAVGAESNSSAATGVDGDQDDISAPYSGAAWLY